MKDFKIYDEKGKWFVNTGLFKFVDAESKIPFEPGLVTKATETEWVKSQPTITKAADPLKEAEAEAPAPAPAPAAPVKK